MPSVRSHAYRAHACPLSGQGIGPIPAVPYAAPLPCPSPLVLLSASGAGNQCTGRAGRGKRGISARICAPRPP